jgi:tetratricopeptide (TPR) repeat protein
MTRRLGATLTGEALIMDDAAQEHEIHQWYIDRQHTKGIRADLVDDIEDRIKSESSAAKLRALKTLLAMQYTSVGRYEDSNRLYDQLHKEYPDNPMPLISLANNKLYYEDNYHEAMTIIDRAIDIAFRSGNFRRYALGVKARIALKIEAHALIEEILKQLMEMRFSPTNFDCGIERDFLDRLPPGAIDKEVARAYDRYSAR